MSEDTFCNKKKTRLANPTPQLQWTITFRWRGVGSKTKYLGVSTCTLRDLFISGVYFVFLETQLQLSRKRKIRMRKTQILQMLSLRLSDSLSEIYVTQCYLPVNLELGLEKYEIDPGNKQISESRCVQILCFASNSSSSKSYRPHKLGCWICQTFFLLQNVSFARIDLAPHGSQWAAAAAVRGKDELYNVIQCHQSYLKVGFA